MEHIAGDRQRYGDGDFERFVGSAGTYVFRRGSHSAKTRTPASRPDREESRSILQSDHLSHRRTNSFRCRLDLLVGQMGIAQGRLHVGVAE